MKLIRFVILICFSAFSIAAFAQDEADSMSLKNILNQVTSNYPAIRKAELDIYAANSRVSLAKSAYLPNLELNSNYTHVGPSSKMTIPNMGSFELYPTENFGASINLYQNIYDFGRTSTNVDIEKQTKSILNLSAEQLKQKLSTGVVNLYYSIVYLQEAIKIKDEQLQTLQNHLKYIQKKKETGSATSYEILTTQVRITGVENQKTDLMNALKVQVCQLNSLLGQPEKNTLIVEKGLKEVQPLISSDSLIDIALKNRKEYQIAQQKANLTKLKYKAVGTQNNPSFNFFASGGIKDGYEPDLYDGVWNYSIGIGFKMPLYDGGRTKKNQKVVQAEIQSNLEDVELNRRTIVNEVVEDQANLESAIKKIAQSELQFHQAEKAYALAETSFKSGVITNLELLDSSTSLSESGLSRLKAYIDYTLNLYKLKLALGEQIY